MEGTGKKRDLRMMKTAGGIPRNLDKKLIYDMQDGKVDQTKRKEQEFLTIIGANQREFNRNLFGDWVIRMYDKCANLCLNQNSLKEDALNQADVRCATNCLKKHSKALSMYDSLEEKISDKLTEDWGIPKNNKDILEAFEEDLADSVQDFNKIN